MREKSTYQVMKEKAEESGLTMATLWLTLEQKDFLARRAREKHLTQSAILREIIDNYMKKNEWRR